MKRQAEERAGSALLTVVGIVAIMTMVCAALGVTATNRVREAQVTRELLKARLIAESGLNKAYRAVKADYSLARTYRLEESFGGGRYTVEAVPLEGVDANRAQLQAVGVCGLGRAVVKIDLERRVQTGAVEGEDELFFPLPYDLLVGGTMKLSGNLYADVTALHSNGSSDMGGSFNLGGAAVTISSAGTASWKKAPATVTLQSGTAAQPISTADLNAAFDRLKAYAEANGAVYPSGASVPAEPPGGVAYITGSSAGWSGEGTGCFIFQGTFSTKHVNLTSVNNYPALVVLSPSAVQFNAGAVIQGAVLLPTSSLKFNGHAAIYGPILVGQTMTGNGTADLYAGGGQGFSLPPQLETTDKLVVTAWH